MSLTKINKFKFDYKIEFECQVSKSVEAMANFLRDVIKTPKESSEGKKWSYEHIPDYHRCFTKNYFQNLIYLKEMAVQGKYIHSKPFWEKSIDKFIKDFTIIIKNI